MSHPRSLEAEKVRNRRLAITAAVLFTLAGGLFGGSAFLQKRAATKVYAREPNRPWKDPAIEKGLRAARFARAKELRERFRPWALKHKDIIKRMMQAKPDDQAALMEAWNALPTLPDGAGVDMVWLGMGTPPFSWAPVIRDRLPNPNPSQQESQERSERAHRERLQKNFAERHDIGLSDSVHAGPSKLHFWISGRITEHTLISNPRPKRGAPAFVDAPPQEVVPPYDFLIK